MAHLNYTTEVYPDSVYPNTVYPERLSAFSSVSGLDRSRSPQSSFRRKKGRRQIRSAAARYKTQPVTFDEITEVDEDNIVDDGGTNAMAEQQAKKAVRLKQKFEEFSRTMDELVNLRFDATIESLDSDESERRDCLESAFRSSRERKQRSRLANQKAKHNTESSESSDSISET